jgi:hypothetical protein
MAKVSKNAKVAQRTQNVGTGRDYVKVIKPVKDPDTGKYSYQELMIHKDEVKDFFAKS